MKYRLHGILQACLGASYTSIPAGSVYSFRTDRIEGGNEPGWLDRSEGVSWNPGSSKGVITSSWLDIVADFLVGFFQVYSVECFLDCVARLVVLSS